MRRPDANIFVLMKPLALSKSRLKDVLSDEERRVLSLAMLARTIRAARDAVAATHVTVVGGDEAVRRLAVLEGVSWREEPATGLNASLSRLLRQPPPNEQDLFVYLPADLPLIEPADVDQLVALTAPSHVVIAPDRWRSGTNALVIPAGADFTPALGRSSFENHKTAAVRAGLTSRVCENPGLLLDVDTPADLEELLSRRPEWWDEANKTVKRLKIDPGIRV
jgi:2-phospho-L-lactate/phosphoenolpyruvate guanylyltransferase